MIEPMTSATVICLEQDRDQTVGRLADLGLVHVVEVSPPESRELEVLTQRADRWRSALGHLDALCPEETAPGEAADTVPDEEQAEEWATRVLDAVNRQARSREELQKLVRIRENLEPWGSIPRERLQMLDDLGMKLLLGKLREDRLPTVPEGGLLHEAAREGRTVRFAMVAPADYEPTFDPLPLPEITELEELVGRERECRERIEAAERKIRDLCDVRAQLRAALDALLPQIEVRRARDGMGAHGDLAYLRGYLPSRREGVLQNAAREAGWALRLDTAPRTDPQVPTALRMPRAFRLARPIFEFLGIVPGYHETDVSPAFLIFLTLFFGLIVGDAGYGVLFLLAAAGLFFTDHNPKHQPAIRLFGLFSVVTIVWGALSGNLFALPRDALPGWLSGLEALKGESQYASIQWLCFLIAGIHLSLARLSNTLMRFGQRAAFGHLGWALVIWANFFLAVTLVLPDRSMPTFAYALYGVGAVLVVTCGVNWGDFGEVFGLPFDVINSFVDLLSYIRLFAVGLSTYFIAASFNDMGAMVCDISPWLVPGAVLVILLGHTLNIGLALLGVLVHGVRLNALEFSNQMGLTWSGHPYEPLASKSKPEPQA